MLTKLCADEAVCCRGAAQGTWSVNAAVSLGFSVLMMFKGLAGDIMESITAWVRPGPRTPRSAVASAGG